MIRSGTYLLALAVAIQPALAGAWTLQKGQIQVLSGATVSRASHSFGRSADQKIVFDKLFVQNWTEYGVTDRLTLFAAPELVLVTDGVAGEKLSTTRATSVEAGGRYALINRVGVLSVQVSAKTAGAFDMSTSAGGQYGRLIELRALYGRGFKLLRRDAFLDLEVGERWIKRPRPNELVVDATAGIWLSSKYMVMLQSFNTIAGGGAKPPYEYYRLHKMQFSLVRRLNKRWSLQSAVFFSPAGQNIVQEQGLVTQLWYKW